mmetsp:Transcript_17582/g.57576  ORF Transcript_17582/g.57576 Transcript_17582/m.57576 type:complete len:456 (+) Transcript_17582:320-1687(+)
MGPRTARPDMRFRAGWRWQTGWDGTCARARRQPADEGVCLGRERRRRWRSDLAQRPLFRGREDAAGGCGSPCAWAAPRGVWAGAARLQLVGWRGPISARAGLGLGTGAGGAGWRGGWPTNHGSRVSASPRTGWVSLSFPGPHRPGVTSPVAGAAGRCVAVAAAAHVCHTGAGHGGGRGGCGAAWAGSAGHVAAQAERGGAWSAHVPGGGDRGVSGGGAGHAHSAEGGGGLLHRGVAWRGGGRRLERLRPDGRVQPAHPWPPLRPLQRLGLRVLPARPYVFQLRCDWADRSHRQPAAATAARPAPNLRPPPAGPLPLRLGLLRPGRHAGGRATAAADRLKHVRWHVHARDVCALQGAWVLRAPGHAARRVRRPRRHRRPVLPFGLRGLRHPPVPARRRTPKRPAAARLLLRRPQRRRNRRRRQDRLGQGPPRTSRLRWGRDAVRGKLDEVARAGNG